MRALNEAFFEVDAFRAFEQKAGIPRNQPSPPPKVGASDRLSPMELRQKAKRERLELKRAKVKA